MPTMIASPGSTWVGALVVAVGLLLVVALFVRYRRLERAGTPLPPGTGGARMVGASGTVVADHLPGQQRGRVRVLGEEWGVADAVTDPLHTGEHVRVREVTGTRLVVVKEP